MPGSLPDAELKDPARVGRSSNVHPKVVQEMLGHSSITQTMDTYSHLMDGMGGDAVGGLDEAFGG